MVFNKNIKPAFILLNLFLAWLTAIFYQGLDVLTLLATQFFLLTTVLISLYQLPNTKIKFPINALTIVLALFWLWIFIAATWSLSPHISQKNIWIISLLPAAFFIFQFAHIEKKHWHYFLYTMIFTGVLISLHAIYQVNTSPQQATSVFLNRNSFAALLNLIIFISIALFFTKYLQNTSRKLLIPLGIAIFIIAYTIGLTQSRGAVIGLFAALVILFLTTQKVLPLKLLLIIIVLV